MWCCSGGSINSCCTLLLCRGLGGHKLALLASESSKAGVDFGLLCNELGDAGAARYQLLDQCWWSAACEYFVLWCTSHIVTYIVCSKRVWLAECCLWHVLGDVGARCGEPATPNVLWVRRSGTEHALQLVSIPWVFDNVQQPRACRWCRVEDPSDQALSMVRDGHFVREYIPATQQSTAELIAGQPSWPAGERSTPTSTLTHLHGCACRWP